MQNHSISVIDAANSRGFRPLGLLAAPTTSSAQSGQKGLRRDDEPVLPHSSQHARRLGSMAVVTSAGELIEYETGRGDRAGILPPWQRRQD